MRKRKGPGSFDFGVFSFIGIYLKHLGCAARRASRGKGGERMFYRGMGKGAHQE